MAPWSLHTPAERRAYNAQKALEYRQRKGQPIPVYESKLILTGDVLRLFNAWLRCAPRY